MLYFLFNTKDIDLDEVTAQDFSISNDHVEITIQLFNLILGRRSYGSGKGSGAVYIRWGRTSCPSSKGTQLLYQGKVGGSSYNHHGGGANYLCVPDSPEYIQTGNVGGNSFLYGAEYKASILSGIEIIIIFLAQCVLQPTVVLSL